MRQLCQLLTTGSDILLLFAQLSVTLKQVFCYKEELLENKTK